MGLRRDAWWAGHNPKITPTAKEKAVDKIMEAIEILIDHPALTGRRAVMLD